MINRIRNLFVLAVLLLSSAQFPAAAEYAERRDAFRNPQFAAKPGVFWDWMGGMISREGITKDLEALAAQGIGRVMIMQMPETCPYPRQWSFRDYPGKVKVLSDEWFALVNFALGECDRLGMQLAIFYCPGWGHVGGPLPRFRTYRVGLFDLPKAGMHRLSLSPTGDTGNAVRIASVILTPAQSQ